MRCKQEGRDQETSMATPSCTLSQLDVTEVLRSEPLIRSDMSETLCLLCVLDIPRSSSMDLTLMTSLHTAANFKMLLTFPLSPLVWRRSSTQALVHCHSSICWSGMSAPRTPPWTRWMLALFPNTNCGSWGANQSCRLRLCTGLFCHCQVFIVVLARWC